MSELTEVILAAGEGKRMGAPKALLPLDGELLVTRAVKAVQSSIVKNALVVVGAEADRVLEVLKPLHARSVINPRWQEGQTSSLKAGLEALPDDCSAFLIHPVDHAFTTSKDLNALATAYFNHPDPERAIIRPYFGRTFGHPVLFARRYAREFLALADHEPGNLVYRRHQDAVLLVPVANPRIAHDLDTPADL